MSYSRYRSSVNETGIIGTQESKSLCEVSDSGGVFFFTQAGFTLSPVLKQENMRKMDLFSTSENDDENVFFFFFFLL